MENRNGAEISHNDDQDNDSDENENDFTVYGEKRNLFCGGLNF